MFEKEAEEYKDTYFGYADERISEVQDFEGNYIDISERIMKTFIDGADFGYKEGIKTLDDMTRAFNREHKKYTDLRIANEWHYVKDGDLPKIGKTCLVYLANGDVITARLREDNVWTTNGHNAFENVTAWKEIVLPKEK